MGVEERMAQIIIEQIRVPEDQVTRQARFVEDLGATSHDMTELVSQFEKEFGIEIPGGEAEKITTVGEAIEYIEAQHKL